MHTLKARAMLVTAYLGAVIGAGFASGQEIVQFFVAYGAYGFRGAILASILFAICGGSLLYLAHRRGASNYQEILALTLGPRAGVIVDLALAVFLFLGISTMLSASGAIFYEHLYLPKNLGIFAAYILAVGLLAAGKKGLIVSYNILVPVKCLLLLSVAAYAAFLSPAETNSQVMVHGAYHQEYWLLAGILYVAYNFSLAMVVLSEYKTLTNSKDGVYGAVWGGLILGFMVCVYYLALCKAFPVVMHYEVPMLYVAGKISITAKHIYTLVLWIGILTTTLANAYGFAQRFTRLTGWNYRHCLIMGITLALPIATRSFSGLVGKIYPLFGVLGIIIMTGLLLKTGKEILGDIGFPCWLPFKKHSP